MTAEQPAGAGEWPSMRPLDDAERAFVESAGRAMQDEAGRLRAENAKLAADLTAAVRRADALEALALREIERTGEARTKLAAAEREAAEAKRLIQSGLGWWPHGGTQVWRDAAQRWLQQRQRAGEAPAAGEGVGDG